MTDASVRVSDHIATIRAALTPPGNPNIATSTEGAAALSALDSLVAALAQAEQDRDEETTCCPRCGATSAESGLTYSGCLRCQLEASENARQEDREEAEARLVQAHEALTMLRDSWNAHMETCEQHAALPDLPTFAEIHAWRDAPSNTAGGPLAGEGNSE